MYMYDSQSLEEFFLGKIVSIIFNTIYLPLKNLASTVYIRTCYERDGWDIFC